jgi:O-antigen ligase
MTVSPAGVTQRPPLIRVSWLPAIAACALVALLMSDLYSALASLFVVLAVSALIQLPLSSSVPLLLFCIPLRLYVQYPETEIDVALTNFVIVGLGAACLMTLFSRGRPRLVGWEWAIAGWALWTVVSLAWTDDPIASLSGVFRWLMIFCSILVATVGVLRAADPALAIRRVLIALLVLVTFWSVIGFVEVALGLDNVVAALQSPVAASLYPPGLLKTRLAAMNFNWRSGATVQPFGPFINAIEFGIFTAIGVGASVALAVGRVKLVPRWLVSTALPLATAANVACLKASGWVAAGVAIAVAFVTLGRSIRRVVAVCIAVVAVLAVLLWVFREEVAARLQDLAAREGTTGATAEAISRPAIWLYYLGSMADHPFVGHGIFSAYQFGPTHWSRTAAGVLVAEQLPTENSYLTTLLETGLVGLVLLLATVGGAVYRGVRLSRRYPADPVAQGAGVAAIGLAALMAGNVTVDAFSGEILGVMLGLLIGVVVAAVRLLPGRAGGSTR